MVGDGQIPTLLEAVARDIGTLKSDSVKVSAAAVAALKMAAELDGEPCPLCERGGPSTRDSVSMFRELRMTLAGLLGNAAGTSDTLSGTDEFTRRMRERDEAARRKSGGGA